MSETYSELIIGITGGIIATGIVGFVVLIFNKIIWPKIRELTYRGINIEDDWICVEKGKRIINQVSVNKKIREYHLTINQNGHKLYGEMSVKNINPENDTEEFSLFKIQGEIKNNYVQIDFNAKSKKSIGIGTLLFNIRKGGNCLIGNLISTEKNSMNIFSIENLDFRREK